MLVPSDIAKHKCFPSEFPNFPSVFDGFLELFVLWTNEVNTSELSRIIEFWFLESPFLLLFRLTAFDMFFHISGHK